MAIVFHCTCGHALRAQADSGGRKTRCPSCNQVLIIPGGSNKAVAVVTASAHGQATHAGGPGTMVATGAAIDVDPFAMELDWTSLKAAPHTQESEQPRPTGGGVGGGTGIKVDSMQAELAHPETPAPEDGSRQYRVLTQKDNGLTGKFNGVRLEEVLNDHAGRGWCLKAAFAMNMPGHGGHHDELVVILER
jgi:hypothetical protein